MQERVRVRGRNDQIKLMAASPPSKELILPAIHVYKGQDSNHISNDAKTKTKFGRKILKSISVYRGELCWTCEECI